MTTEKRLEAVKGIISSHKPYEVDPADKIMKLERAMIQLYLICRNQEAEISLLKQQIEGINKFLNRE